MSYSCPHYGNKILYIVITKKQKQKPVMCCLQFEKIESLKLKTNKLGMLIKGASQAWYVKEENDDLL